MNSLADTATSVRGAGIIFDNPIYMALVATFIILLIFYLSGAVREDMPRIKTFFYIFSALLAIIFVYHRRFQKMQKEHSSVSAIRGAMANVQTAGIDSVPITPAIPLY